MLITEKKTELRQIIQTWKTKGKKIAFVPTMGNLHEGHLTLIRQAKQLADYVVVSIFVNPIQFDRQEDLYAYPRTLTVDKKKLLNNQVDFLFIPTAETMYPNQQQLLSIEIGEMGNILEGASRKGHFSGVATVVAKLFNLVQADFAVFGQKDFQQLMVIQKLVRDLNFPIKIIAGKTVRETNGLAMSSRNQYLTPKERKIAPNLYHILMQIKESIQQDKQNYPHLQQWAKQQLTKIGFNPDYIEIRRCSDLQPPQAIHDKLVILAAAWLGKARLIDNIVIK